jgi:hypothetical protein
VKFPGRCVMVFGECSNINFLKVVFCDSVFVILSNILVVFW